MTVRYGAVALDWLGGPTTRVEGELGVVVYTDPTQAGVDAAEELGDGLGRHDADLVLVSESRHYDPDAIRRVAHEETLVVVHESVTVEPGDLSHEIERVRADESFVLGPLDLFTTQLGRENRRTSGQSDGDGCGYAVTIDGVRVFWPGRSTALEADLDADVLLTPIGDDGVGGDAAATLEQFRPGLVVPVAYDPENTDAGTFVVDVASRGVPVALDESTGDRDSN
ncbi:MBL fold metallo-hydrolase [Halobacteria archaeon AArc-dxtr1]|nr:MBL fold metallo-hydrolase [Halobacteria archaeon AArc-dxtr1]